MPWNRRRGASDRPPLGIRSKAGLQTVIPASRDGGATVQTLKRRGFYLMARREIDFYPGSMRAGASANMLFSAAR